MDDKGKMKVITMDDVTDEIIDFDDLESQLEGKLGKKYLRYEKQRMRRLA